MTNPGSFEFHKTDGWTEFKSGMAGSNVLEAEDYPDLTMQNVIEVIRTAHEVAGLGYPSGIVRIHNVSNVHNLVSWSKETTPKVISAIDNNGRFSHPRRWRIEPYLKQQTIQSLSTLLQKQGSHANVVI